MNKDLRHVGISKQDFVTDHLQNIKPRYIKKYYMQDESHLFSVDKELFVQLTLTRWQECVKHKWGMKRRQVLANCRAMTKHWAVLFMYVGGAWILSRQSTLPTEPIYIAPQQLQCKGRPLRAVNLTHFNSAVVEIQLYNSRPYVVCTISW